VESNQIYPSLPALLKLAEVLFVEVSSLFQGLTESEKRFIFSFTEAVDVNFPDFPEGTVYAKLLTPMDFDRKGEAYLIEISPHKRVPSHFFAHKGEEVGYVLSGKLQVQVEKAVHTLRTGDAIYLTSEIPTEWKNLGAIAARLLWIKIK
jgi:quercetin dioxygenase-like cupin family protein